MASVAPTAFCSLCGVVLANNGDPGIQAPGRGWLGLVRAIYTRSSQADAARVSEPGVITGHNVLSIPSSTLPGVRQTITLFRNHGSDWGYGLHEACWQLLRAELGGRVDESAIAMSLFQQFYCTPCPQHACLDFGHDYDSALSIGPLGPANSSDGSHFTFTDPLTMNLSQIEQNAPPSPSWTRLDVESDKRSAFGRLPTEIFHDILLYLPHTEVKQLRLVCRELATLICPEALPMSFWRAQFWPSRVYGFIFADTNQTRDWSKAFRGVTCALGNGDPALINRRRIVGLLKHVAALVEFDAASSRSRPSGTALSEPLNMHFTPVVATDSDQGDRPQYEQTPLTGRRSTTGEDSLASDDCREVHTRKARVPFQGDASFAISFAPFGPRTYVTGISWTGKVCGGVGYCQSPQNSCQIPPESSVEALQVTFCTRGLIGIKWNFTDGTSSPWIGESQGKGAARGILIFRKENQMAHLVVGLDVCVPRGVGKSAVLTTEKHYKIVSIGITYEGKTRHFPHCPPVLTVASTLWVPDVPRHKRIFSELTPNHLPRSTFALLDIDFGGLQGSLLGLLTRMVVFVSTSPCPIAGMEFFYTDGSTRSFGMRGQSEISFYLDGPGGERISEVIFVDDGTQPGLTGFTVLTNFGRRMDFVTLRSLCQDSSKTCSHKPPDGYVMTGFAATSQDDHLVQLGIQSQPATTRLVHTLSLDFCNARIRPDSMWRKSVCDYHTYASLRGVRRITAFVGMKERSRLPSDICGLKVDYHDCRAPSVVGQLMQEANSVDLFRHECIQAMTIWMTGVSPLPPETDQIPKQGKVVAARIETTLGHTADFGPYGSEYPPMDGCVGYRYEAEGRNTLVADPY
ncbi:predicted protein [Aspergillus terreus NIH2624]|uniref:F-box domain-containing protein n=1 Tax=Aspergillus terreus (strain NIH 2624 / FGSC A1156) TaxID=341663 RepID=Q0CDF3_ASPTN|nr:uncharacterized protein ATEG_08281 [Aspergillus terreus NIH2624]EAU31454.1 predicted protein [Aspergillus terreus NIH2624]